MTEPYTDEHIKWLRRNVPKHTYLEAWEMFNKKFPERPIPSVSAISSLCKRKGIHPNSDGRFKKGHISPTAGLKQSEYLSPEALERTKATRFSKGQMPANYKPVGSTRLNVDGYIDVKIADPNKWQLRSRIVWEENYGEIPKGMVVLHINGIKVDDRPENLMLATRQEVLRLNRDGLCVEGATEINTSAIALAKVEVKASERRRNKK